MRTREMVSLLAFLLTVPAARPADSADERTVRAADGTEIVYEVRGGGEPALVFVHCWACNRDFWREQLDEFARDHTVVALDLPGHGASGRDRQAWTLEAYADDVVRVIDDARLDRVVLVGHSMGGPVALLAAPRLGDRLQGVLCVDTLHDVAFEWPEEAIERWLGGFEQDYEGALNAAVAAMTPGEDELRAWIVEEAMAAHREAMLTVLRQFPELDLAAALAAVEAPVRCVNAEPYSEGSRPTAIESNRRYADFDAITLDGVGHYLQLERPQEFNEKLRQMLAEIEGGD